MPFWISRLILAFLDLPLSLFRNLPWPLILGINSSLFFCANWNEVAENFFLNVPEQLRIDVSSVLFRRRHKTCLPYSAFVSKLFSSKFCDRTSFLHGWSNGLRTFFICSVFIAGRRVFNLVAARVKGPPTRLNPTETGHSFRLTITTIIVNPML